MNTLLGLLQLTLCGAGVYFPGSFSGIPLKIYSSCSMELYTVMR
jgi:hypothetical protein